MSIVSSIRNLIGKKPPPMTYIPTPMEHALESWFRTEMYKRQEPAFYADNAYIPESVFMVLNTRIQMQLYIRAHMNAGYCQVKYVEVQMASGLATEYFFAQRVKGADRTDAVDDERRLKKLEQQTGLRYYSRMDLVRMGVDPSPLETWILTKRPPAWLSS